jgi:hypothetical protein
MRHKAQLASHLEGREQRAVNLLATIDLAEEVLKSEIATDEVNSSSESFDNVLYDEIPEDIDRSSRGAGEMTHVKRGDSGTHAVQALDPLEDMLPQPYETVVQQPSATVEVERSEAIYEQIPADMDRLNQVAGDFLKVEFKVGKHLSDLQKQLILINGCIAEGTVHHEAVSANANGIRNVILDRLEKMRQAANDRHTHKINAQQGLRAEECIALIREIDLTKARMLQLRSN